MNETFNPHFGETASNLFAQNAGRTITVQFEISPEHALEIVSRCPTPVEECTLCRKLVVLLLR